ncbi:MAG: hypothetical protein Q9182_000034 [Xanthomendoza sp. 2 TL-2023]
MDSQTESLLHREEDAMIGVKGSKKEGLANRGSELKSKKFQIFIVPLSVTLNIVLAIWLALQKADVDWPEPSKYAGLLRNVPLEWNPYSPYGVGNKNESDRSIMWESLDASPGLVSLDKAWTLQHGLPAAQDFPWDRSRSLYLLNGHHSLHCLRKVRRWVTIAYHNGTQLDGYPHLVHCMDHLLQNILCEADDTPMYTTQTVAKDAGLHQTRMCRSWDQLNKWAEQQTSCYVFINETQGVSTTFNRYKWCPKGSLYAEKMLIHMNLPPGWYEERPAEIDSMPPYWINFQDQILKFDENTAI